MSTPIVAIDCETTGIHPGRRPWEIALIRRDDQGEREFVCQIADVDLSEADPFGLKVGRFYDRHFRYSKIIPNNCKLMDESQAVYPVEQWTRGAHIVGCVPNFDTETLDAMLRRHKLIPAWHHHLIDVEAMAIGYLSHKAQTNVAAFPDMNWAPWPPLPWKSEDISKAVGVEPPSEEERHTALGDARWAMRLYDAIVGGEAA